MNNSDNGFGPLSEKKFNDKELKIVIGACNLLWELSDDEDEVAEFRKYVIKRMEITISNATKIKEAMEAL